MQVFIVVGPLVGAQIGHPKSDPRAYVLWPKSVPEKEKGREIQNKKGILSLICGV